MAYEVWLFSDQARYRRNGGIVAVEKVPPSYSLGDAMQYGEQLKKRYVAIAGDITHVVRSERAY